MGTSLSAVYVVTASVYLIKCLEMGFDYFFSMHFQGPGIKNKNECPHILTDSFDKAILVHSGQSKQIAVRTSNLKVNEMLLEHKLKKRMPEA